MILDINFLQSKVETSLALAEINSDHVPYYETNSLTLSFLFSTRLWKSNIEVPNFFVDAYSLKISACYPFRNFYSLFLYLYSTNIMFIRINYLLPVRIVFLTVKLFIISYYLLSFISLLYFFIILLKNTAPVKLSFIFSYHYILLYIFIIYILLIFLLILIYYN